MSTPSNPDNGPSFGGQHSTALAISTVIVFLGSAGSRVLGLVREQLAAGNFGTGNDIAAFTVADNLNTLLFDLLVNGMLQAAFVPVLALLAIGEAAQRGHLRRVGGTLLVLVGGAGLVVAMVGIAAAPAGVSLITAIGGNELIRGEDARQLAIDCTRLILISLPFLGAAAILSAMLYAREKPSGPALAAIARNGAIVVGILIFGDAMGVRSMALGVVAGAISMVVLLLHAARRNNATPHLVCDLHDPAVHRVLRLAVPVFAGLLVSAAVVILDRNLAWRAEENAVGAMRYATTLVQLVLGLVAAAVSIAALPRLAQAHASAAENPSGFDRELSRSLALVTSLMIPAVVALGVLSRPIVRLLFEHGATDRDASRMIVTALLLYLPGHLVVAWDQVLIFAFYAQQNTILPVTVGVIAAGAYSLTALALFDRHGMAGLVI
ncbi:MAG: lipid II flippase MurJ, partial [Thermomicrobiales bacterium]